MQWKKQKCNLLPSWWFEQKWQSLCSGWPLSSALYGVEPSGLYVAWARSLPRLSASPLLIPLVSFDHWPVNQNAAVLMYSMIWILLAIYINFCEQSCCARKNKNNRKTALQKSPFPPNAFFLSPFIQVTANNCELVNFTYQIKFSSSQWNLWLCHDIKQLKG